MNSTDTSATTSTRCPAQQATQRQAETPGDLATTWNAVAQADLFRLMDRSDANSARGKARFHAVEDALASAAAGKTIDTSGVTGEEMDVRVNSDNITYQAAPPPPAPRPVPREMHWMIGLCAALLVLLAWMAARPAPSPAPMPGPLPAPAPLPGNSGQWQPSIQVK